MPQLKYVFFLSIFLTGICFYGQQPKAMEMVDRIVAVVGDDIITHQDLADRLRFAAKNIQTELTNAQKTELLHTQLNELIEEQLILQYAQENNHQASEAQIQQAIVGIEQRNKQPVGSFLKFAGDEKETALKSIKASVLTNLITERELRPQANVSDEEVRRIVDGILLRKDENTEKKIAQIFLPVAENSEEEKIRKSIHRLHQQLSEGQPFENLARAYSRDRSATDGGQLGWFRLEELVPAISSVIAPLSKGEISKPIRSANGWHIFKILDVRTPQMPDLSKVKELKLIQLYAPIDSTSGTPAPLQNKTYAEAFKALKKGLKTKEQFKKMVAKKKQESPLYIASGDMGWVKQGGLAANLQSALRNAEKGKVVGPISTDNGTYLFYIDNARSTEPDALVKIRQRVQERLVSRQTDLALRRLIRNLRRRAFVDIRL